MQKSNSNLFLINFSMFACVTAALSFGGAVERATVSFQSLHKSYFLLCNIESILFVIKLRGYVVFLVLWFVVVYAFVANWVWSLNGWIRTLGALDYAGGTPVHIVSGFSGLA